MKRIKNLHKQFHKLYVTFPFVKENNSKTPNMWLLIAFFISLSFSSCDNEVFFQRLYLVDNEVNKEFLIHFESSKDGSMDELPIKITNKILPNQVNSVLYYDVKLIPESLTGTPYFNIWIYNPIDSVYGKLNADDFRTIDGNLTVERTHSKTDLIKYIFRVQIDEALIGEMTKDTALTDSIFGLK
jgi:hypothetical protein